MRFRIKRRLFYLSLGAVAFLVAYYIGATTKLSDKDASDLKKQFADQTQGIDQYGIFANNMRIALGMFIPAFGAGLGVFSGLSTGMVFSALAKNSPILSSYSPLIIMISPFGVMEVFAYGLAMSRSGMLVYQLVKRKPWREYVVPTAIEVGIAVVVLLVAAIIEWGLIVQFGGLAPGGNSLRL